MSAIQAFEIVHVYLQANLVCNCRDLQRRADRATECHVHGHGVLEGALGDDIAWLDVLFHELHYLHAAAVGKLQARAVRRWDAAVARQCQAECFGQAIH